MWSWSIVLVLGVQPGVLQAPTPAETIAVVAAAPELPALTPATPPPAEKPAETLAPPKKPAETPPPAEKPAETPPAAEKPAETPPAAKKPAETPTPAIKPAETPPAAEKPAETPPAAKKPAEKPPAAEKPAATPTPATKSTGTPVPREESADAPGAKAASPAETGTAAPGFPRFLMRQTESMPPLADLTASVEPPLAAKHRPCPHYAFRELPGVQRLSDTTETDECLLACPCCEKYFRGPAHFPLWEFGPFGQAIEREGAVIYEGMRFVIDGSGNYEVSFVISTPALPTTLRLYLDMVRHPAANPRDPEDRHANCRITLPPIHIGHGLGEGSYDSVAVRSGPAGIYRVRLTGYCDKLRGVHEVSQLARDGTARFGYGRADYERRFRE